MEEEGDMMFGIRIFNEYAEHYIEDFEDEEKEQPYAEDNKQKCICNEGIHDKNRVDCACGCHK